MKSLLKKIEENRPEVIFSCKDGQTDAGGWVVINSLQGEAADGVMRKGLDKSKAEAKTMEVKFTVSGQAIGGAKSGINFEPSNSRKKRDFTTWHKTVMPHLKNYYGSDLNADEIYRDSFQRFRNSFKTTVIDEYANI